MTKKHQKEVASLKERESYGPGSDAGREMARDFGGTGMVKSAYIFVATIVGVWSSVNACGPTSPCCTQVNGI